MPSLASLTAAPTLISVGDRELLITPLTVRDHGEIETIILAARPDPIPSVIARLANLEQSVQRYLLGMVFDEMVRGWPVTAHEVALWMSTREGTACVLWLSARKHQPQLALETCRELLLSENLERVQRRLDELNGLVLGNDLGRNSRPKRKPATRAARQSSNGEKYSVA